jgi:hypothetical protein
MLIRTSTILFAAAVARECFPNDYIRGHTLAGAFESEPKKPCGFAVE